LKVESERKRFTKEFAENTEKRDRKKRWDGSVWGTVSLNPHPFKNRKGAAPKSRPFEFAFARSEEVEKSRRILPELKLQK
jgi:hypothetical protein